MHYFIGLAAYLIDKSASQQLPTLQTLSCPALRAAQAMRASARTGLQPKIHAKEYLPSAFSPTSSILSRLRDGAGRAGRAGALG